jgi:hypothetical protein
MSDPTPPPDRDRSAPVPDAVTGKGGVPRDIADARDKGVAAGLFGTLGCLGVTFAGGVFIAAAVLAFVLVRGCGADDGRTPPQPMDPVEVQKSDKGGAAPPP